MIYDCIYWGYCNEMHLIIFLAFHQFYHLQLTGAQTQMSHPLFAADH